MPNKVDAATAAEQTTYRDAAKEQAITFLGSLEAYNHAIALLTSWVNEPFSWHMDPAITEPIDQSISPDQFRANVASFNALSALDWTYYYGDYAINQGLSNAFGESSAANALLSADAFGPLVANKGNPRAGATTGHPGSFQGTPVYCTLPDTLDLSLGEIACLRATGAIASDEAADAVALHLVLAQMWSWRRGEITDGDPQVGHLNFARVLGIISAKMQKAPPRLAATSAPSAAATQAGVRASLAYAALENAAAGARVVAMEHAATPPAAAAAAPPSRWPKLLEALALAAAGGALIVLTRGKKRNRTP